MIFYPVSATGYETYRQSGAASHRRRNAPRGRPCTHADGVTGRVVEQHIRRALTVE